MKKQKKQKNKFLISQSEIEKELKEENEKLKKLKKKNLNDEPSWYHYIFAIIIVIGFFLLLIFGFKAFDNYKNSKVKIEKNGLEVFYKNYNINNISARIEYYTLVNEIENLNFENEISKIDILNSQNFKFVYLENSTNEDLIITTSRVFNSLKLVYNYKNIINELEDIKCSGSTNKIKTIYFNSKANETKIKFNKQNGCIEFLAKNKFDMVKLGDIFLYELFEN